MDTQFENTTIQTKEILRQAAACIMRKKLIIHAVVLLTLGIGFLIFVLFKGTDAAYFFGIAFSFACISIAIYRFDSVPKKFAERTYSNQLKLFKEPATLVVSVRAQTLSVENRQQNSLHTYSFSECVKLLENKAVVVLKTEKKTYILLDKAGFTKGTAEDFVALLRR